MADGETPTFDFDEIMRRIRAEVRRRRAPTEPVAPALAADVALDVSVPDLEQFDARLQAAEQVADVGLRLPPMHRQRGLRRWLAAKVAKAFLRLSELVSRDQRVFNRSVVYSLRALGVALQDQSRRVGGRLEAVTPQLEALGQRETRLEEVAEQLVKEAEALRAILSETAASLRTEQRRVVEQGTTRAVEQEKKLIEASSQISNLRVAVLLQERRISTLLETISRQPTEQPGSQQSTVAAQEEAHMLDAMYVEFEDAYRGTREDIKQRSREYMLAPVREAGAGTPDRPVLDLGCGRGEWLEVLREESLDGRGVDLNRAFIHKCRERGLHVEEADALSYLKALPDGCLGAVTAIHLLEHLPFLVLVAVLDEAVRVLKPGGLVIFETPNPTNLTVGARDFYLDPTHRNPLHPDTMRFLAERRGLVRVSVLPLHPYAPELRLPDDGTQVTQRLNALFYGPRDFAIVGYRA